ncbi:MAG: hypothetical protein JOZ63_01590 [Planctomycetaceae bacterium]|nr:hypothetical protein [Planctomycetaceae bacterium]
MTVTLRTVPPNLREAQAVAELCVDFLRRDLLAFYPQSRFEPVAQGLDPASFHPGLDFALIEEDAAEENGDAVQVELFGVRYRLTPREGIRFTPHDRRMIRAVGAVLGFRYYHLFQRSHGARLELFQGGSEDHYVAAFVEPSVYAVPATRPSRVAPTLQALRTAALSTYENRRVSTGALLLGAGGDPDHLGYPTAPDALPYGPELTSLKSIHRLCDGRRTLFLVDRAGKLADIIAIERWASEMPGPSLPAVPCARAFAAHARATGASGHVCVVLSPNQEIKLFAGGSQAFAFAHGRWRILDPASKFAVWESAVAHPPLARVLFQTALDLAESRHGGLFVVVADPGAAVGRLIAPHDLLVAEAPDGPPAALPPGDPLARRALHYLARGRGVTELAPPVLEALAGLDGALATDRAGRLLAFGAILRHDASCPTAPPSVEGARTTAALVASHFGPVLKVSEDGIVSCFLNGARAWDL